MSTVDEQVVYITWPVGSINIRPWYGTVAAVDAAGTVLIELATGSYSKNVEGAWKLAGSVIGPAENSTRTFGSRHAGASTVPWAWLLICGIVGPATHVPGWLAIAGGVYSAVNPVAPMANTRPSGSSTWAPISRMLSTSDCGVAPAATQVSAAMTYFSALGGLVASIDRIVPSGSSDQ